MRRTLTAAAATATLIVALSSAVSSGAPAPAATQVTLFNTKDFRQDKALWANPAYYRNNTPGQLRGMAIGVTPMAMPRSWPGVLLR